MPPHTQAILNMAYKLRQGNVDMELFLSIFGQKIDRQYQKVFKERHQLLLEVFSTLKEALPRDQDAFQTKIACIQGLLRLSKAIHGTSYSPNDERYILEKLDTVLNGATLQELQIFAKRPHEEDKATLVRLLRIVVKITALYKKGMFLSREDSWKLTTRRSLQNFNLTYKQYTQYYGRTPKKVPSPKELLSQLMGKDFKEAGQLVYRKLIDLKCECAFEKSKSSLV